MDVSSFPLQLRGLKVSVAACVVRAVFLSDQNMNDAFFSFLLYRKCLYGKSISWHDSRPLNLSSAPLIVSASCFNFAWLSCKGRVLRCEISWWIGRMIVGLRGGGVMVATRMNEAIGWRGEKLIGMSQSAREPVWPHAQDGMKQQKRKRWNSGARAWETGVEC